VSQRKLLCGFDGAAPCTLVDLDVFWILKCVREFEYENAQSLATLQTGVQFDVSGAVCLHNIPPWLIPTPECVAASSINLPRHRIIERTLGTKPRVGVVIVGKRRKLSGMSDDIHERD
jgi:hypothetical protein